GGYERAAFLEPLPMPGAAAAIRAPWRMALSYLRQTFGEGYRDLDIAFLSHVDPHQAEIIDRMAIQGINAPRTSSMGRLFDGVAALIGLRHTVAFEGQAAMELEMCAAAGEEGHYEVAWQDAAPIVIPTAPIIAGVVADLQQGRAPSRISRRFHTTLVRLFTALCGHLRHRTGLDRVVLSGGVFQNALLLQELSHALASAGFSVYNQRLVPPNDGGIALGQAVVAGTLVADGAAG
ncbi:MAG TPA: carbamoyltransferase HypF, partial [Desulfosarcina sp.]|nr:carbamoyltransferase HypF [Desulfosarcina sp.]